MVLLDIGLPGMDGFEVATHMRRMPSLDATIILALSRCSKELVAQRYLDRVHFNHHLLKPVDPGRLEQLIKIIKS